MIEPEIRSDAPFVRRQRRAMPRAFEEVVERAPDFRVKILFAVLVALALVGAGVAAFGFAHE